jgi:hypothetical protein
MRHQAAVEDVVGRFAERGIAFVEIYYGYGATAELVLDIDCEDRERELTELFEALRTDERTKMSILDQYLHLSASERDHLAHTGHRRE